MVRHAPCHGPLPPSGRAPARSGQQPHAARAGGRLGAPLSLLPDVYDHILRVTESSDSLRDLVSTIVETNLSLRDYRQNQIVKKVSSWAAIIAVPALVTGYYGMNVPYPGFGNDWGVAISAALMVGVSVALYLLFRRLDWL